MMTQPRSFREDLCTLYTLWCEARGANPRRSVSRFETEMDLAPGSVNKILRGKRKSLEWASIDRLVSALCEGTDSVLDAGEREEWRERLRTARAVELTKSHVVTGEMQRHTAGQRLLERIEGQFSDFYTQLPGTGDAPSGTSPSYVPQDDTALPRLIQNMRTTLRRSTDEEVRRAADTLSYFADWALGRLYISQFDMERAVPQMTWVVTLTENDPTNNWRDLIYFDMADAYAIAGDLVEAESFATSCEEFARKALQPLPGRTVRSATAQRRAHMGTARALVMKQEIAYERGNQHDCLAWHAQATEHLDAAGDDYGWAKSYFFLSLFQLWQGNLADAAGSARRARDSARKIRPKLDFWWAVRDGLFLGAPWWRVITRAHLLDVLACSGDGASREFSELLLAHQRLPRPFTRDLPPFTPRYLWVSEMSGNEVPRFERQFQQWSAESEALGCKHLHVDILLSYGDFLRWGKRDETAAQRAETIYREARQKALAAPDPRNHYLLLAEAAARRLSATTPPFPGLARLAAV